MRRVMLAGIALGLMAFAPAPFPRTGREARDEMSLHWCQGTWEVISNEHVSGLGNKVVSEWGVSHIRINGSRWTLMDKGREIVSYTIAVDGSKRPGFIDWFPLEQPNARTLWVGLIQRRGDRVLIHYTDGSAEKRARDFETLSSGFLITVRREGR